MIGFIDSITNKAFDKVLNGVKQDLIKYANENPRATRYQLLQFTNNSLSQHFFKVELE